MRDFKTSAVVACLLLTSIAGSAAAREATQAPSLLADNAATSTPATTGKAPDSTAYPNSPNGSPSTTAKGAPVVTDRAGCGNAGMPCTDSPSASGKADTSDTVRATPTTTNAR